jgi:hypothetical protein
VRIPSRHVCQAQRLTAKVDDSCGGALLKATLPWCQRRQRYHRVFGCHFKEYGCGRLSTLTTVRSLSRRAYECLGPTQCVLP